MSIPVDVSRLAEALGDFGSGYLLSVSGQGRVKAVTVDPVVRAGVLEVPGPSRGTAANVAGNAAVTLVFPPAQLYGYTLIVDGVAQVAGEGFVVTPETAVLHRPAAHADGPPPTDGCGHDCRPVG
ncbi:MAG TPA: pyridoxamine 5'-phosphate oxidase [Nocardioides sp.]|uniref:pyridoxamine 5'-phosphate oxidase n=1 Tax=Nocardioides sp. TaxID=35761 RepID=UPI002C6198DA|nr:pyridoxamine 5'-phosphate oxidase [Nocardioides sp.]HQR26073.1 pyridoxamine 5'-phosphate oxidase [Nocardioides sp.]